MPKIDLGSEVGQRLARAAETTGRSPSELVTEAVLTMLDDLEDVACAEAELAEIAAGRSRTRSLQEVRLDLGLAD